MTNLYPKINSISLVLLLVIFIPKVFSEECEYKPCGDEPHSVCIYPEKLDKTQPRCSGQESIAGLKRGYREGILDHHNRLRQKVAQGETRQPKAANMMKLKWDMELEEIAQRFVNSCPDLGHDRCRNLKDGTSVGQNSGQHVFKHKKKPNRIRAVKNVISRWYNEITDMKAEYVRDFSAVDPMGEVFAKIGHYTQLVWAETDRVGCGYLEYNHEDSFQFILMNCNYAVTGNTMNRGTAIYKEGEPCSKCPAGTNCSTIYPGLCTAETDERMAVGIPGNVALVAGEGAGNPVYGGASWAVILVASIFRNLM